MNLMTGDEAKIWLDENVPANFPGRGDSFVMQNAARGLGVTFEQGALLGLLEWCDVHRRGK